MILYSLSNLLTIYCIDAVDITLTLIIILRELHQSSALVEVVIHTDPKNFCKGI